MRCRSFLTLYACLSCCLCFSAPAQARPASDPVEATFWIRGIQQLYFASDSGRRDFGASVGLTLPWELLWAQAATPAAPGGVARAPVAVEREAVEHGAVEHGAVEHEAVEHEAVEHEAVEREAVEREAVGASDAGPQAHRRAPAPARAAHRSAVPNGLLSASLVRVTLLRAYSAQGADVAESRLESLDARSRWSAALPELRLRAARATDESERLSPTIEDPYRYTRDGGTDLAFEVSLTWRLSGLVFSAPEVSVERIRSERAQRRVELRREVLKLLFAWQRARIVAEDQNALDDERHEAALTRLETELTLNALTGGWFNERRLLEAEAPRRADPLSR